MIKPETMLKKLNLFMLGIVLILGLSCSKEKEVNIDEKDLTSCEKGASCKYLFTEKSDLDKSPIVVIPGDYRLFLVENTIGASQVSLFIKAPMDTQQFTLNDKDIQNGKVKYYQVCLSCDYVALKPIGGSVKGKNLTPEKPANQSKWLIEATILMEGVNNPTVKHTVYVKQYFTPNF